MQFLFRLCNPKLCRSFSTDIKKVTPIQTLLKSGFTPTLKSINCFLLFLLYCRRFKLVIHFFSVLNFKKIVCNNKTSSIIAWAFLKSHKYEEAEYLMKIQMIKFSNFSTNFMWNSLVDGLNQNDPEKTLSVVQYCLKNRGILFSSYTFYSLIQKFCSEGKMDKAIEALDLMTRGNIKNPFNNFVCNSVISGFCKIGKPELAVGFFQNAVISGGLRPNIASYTSLVCALCKLDRVDEVCDVVSKIEEEGLVLDVIFYSCWICGYISGGRLLDMFRRNKEMLKKGISADTVSYTILIDGFSKLGNVERAVGFLEKMRKDNLKPNLVTYTAIMSGFCKLGKLDEALEIFNMVKALEMEVDEFAYATLINGYCMSGDFNRAFHLLNEMENKGINSTTVAYNIVINGLCKFGRTSEADVVSKRILADVITYSTLLQGYIMEKNLAGILETRSRMEDSGICMDVIMCNILIKAFFMVGTDEDARELFMGMSKLSLVANSVTYSAMIDGYSNIGRIDQAVDVFDEFMSSSSFSATCYNNIINRLCNNGMIDLACEIFIKLNEKAPQWNLTTHMKLIMGVFEEKGAAEVCQFINRMENFNEDIYSIICNDIIRFLCKKGFPMEAYQIMRRKGLDIMKDSYYSIIRALIRDGKMGLCQPILNKFLKDYGIVEIGFCKILLHYLCMEDVNDALWFLEKVKKHFPTITIPVNVFKELIKSGRASDAYKLFRECGRNLPPMNVFNSTIMIDGLCKGGYITEALDFCMFVQKNKIALDIVSYNSVINGLCSQCRFIEAFRLFDSLELIGLTPSEITFATLISALCREGFLQDGIQLLERMVLKGLKPTTRIYNSLVYGYSKIGRFKEAMKFLNDLETKGLKPDEFTVSVAVKCCCQMGDMEEALAFFLEFKQKGVSPDFLSFLYLVTGFSTKGRMEEARNILREMLQSDSVNELLSRIDIGTDTEPIGSFLSILCEQGNIHEAVTVLKEVGTLFFGPQRLTDGVKLHRVDDGLEDFESDDSSSSMMDHGQNYLKFESSYRNEVRRGVKNKNTGKESQLHDFNFYYSLLSSLCSRGELQKANEISKMLCNVDGS